MPKAWQISRKAAVQYCLFSKAQWIMLVMFSKAQWIMLVMRCTCSMVVCFLLNPNWWFGIIFVDCKMGCIRVMKSFSKRGLEVDWLACRTLHLQQVYQAWVLWQFGIPSIVQGSIQYVRCCNLNWSVRVGGIPGPSLKMVGWGEFEGGVDLNFWCNSQIFKELRNMNSVESLPVHTCI
jgi:hypothetical protein